MQKERKCCTKRTPFFSKTLPTSHSKLEGPGHTNSFSVVSKQTQCSFHSNDSERCGLHPAVPPIHHDSRPCNQVLWEARVTCSDTTQQGCDGGERRHFITWKYWPNVKHYNFRKNSLSPTHELPNCLLAVQNAPNAGKNDREAERRNPHKPPCADHQAR